MKLLLLSIALCWAVLLNGQDDLLFSSKPFIHSFETPDAEALKEFVKEIAKEKTIIGLGEVSHYTKECYELKHQMILALMDQGFDGLVLEVDFGQALYWNDYVLNGVGNLDTLIASSWWFTYRTVEFKNLLRDIRNFNKEADKPFQIYGMEMTATNHNITWMQNLITESGIADSTLIKLLNKERKVVAFNSFNEEEIRDYWNLFYALRYFITNNKEALTAQMNPEKIDIAERIMEIIRQFATYISQDDFSLQLAFRDEFSVRNISWCLGAEGRRLALWAHNGHVAKKSIVSNYDVVGHYLEQWFGEAYYAIGFTFNEGTFGAFSDEGFKKWEMPRSDNNSLTSTFSVFKKPFLLFDIRENLKKDKNIDSYLRKELSIRTDISEYHTDDRPLFMQINLSKTYDALIYIDKTHFPTTIDWIR